MGNERLYQSFQYQSANDHVRPPQVEQSSAEPRPQRTLADEDENESMNQYREE